MDPKKILDQFAGASEQYKVYQKICSGYCTTILRLFCPLPASPNEEIKSLISLLDVKHWVSNISPPHPSLVQQGNYLCAAPFLSEPNLYKTQEKCEDGNKLDELYRDLYNKRQRFIGYPVNQSFDYSALFRFLDFSFNNYGDPFFDSNYSLNTHSIERTVVSTFAKLLGTELNETWGYVTSGTTESHIFSLQAARDTFPDGVVYFSTSTHSSIGKAVRLLRMAYVVVGSLDDGEIDYRALECEIGFRLDKPAIIVVNIGTTMTGAIDSLPRISAILDCTGVPGRYIHADAALSGMILPFVDLPQPFRFTDGLDSIAISGHKMIGSPLPCGVVLARRTYVTHIQQSGEVEYVRCMDTTIASSRSAFAPLILYHALRMHRVLDDEDEIGDCSGMRSMVKKALEMAEYAVDMMNERDIPAWRHQNSLTVVFPRPTVQVERKWYLAATNNIAHVMVMPGITVQQIESLVSDLCEERYYK